MKKFLLTVFCVMSIASASYGEDSAFYLRTARSFKDDTNRGALGLVLSSAEPGLYFRVAGEFGGIWDGKTDLDYVYDAAAGWKFGNANTALAVFGIAGFRQWVEYGAQRSTSNTFFPGAGLKFSSNGTYVTGEAYRYQSEKAWRPYVEIGTGNKRQFLGAYYEKSQLGGNVAGIRYGVCLQ